ncbi:hypothetical protein ACH5RR_028444 [Cinchona calisaya]|uniref:Uncharacterized protein n=1 Tax=Cinchona calisaya TaxID=153742 RepID=A0ABD2YU45_9GENT
MDPANSTNPSRAEELKVLANEAFKGRKYSRAIDLYTQAIEVNGDVAVYWANRAFAHTKLEEYGNAILDATKAVEIDPKYSKGYYRRGAAHLAMGKFKEALKDFQQVEKLCPNDPDTTKKLKECEKAVMKLKFEEAISVSESQRRPVAVSVDYHTIGGKEDFKKKEVALTCVESVMHDVELLLNNKKCNPCLINPIENLNTNLQFLKTFMLCARKWSNSDVYWESKDNMKLDLQSFLSSIEVTVNKIGWGIKSLSHRSESSIDNLSEMLSNSALVDSFKKNIESFKQEIMGVYITLSNYSSSQSSFCMRDDELVDFIDSILQNLVKLLHFLYVDFDSIGSYNNVLHAQIEALQNKLTLFKNFIGFGKLFCVQCHKFEDLLTHIQFVVLNAARLSYMCLFYKEDENVQSLCELLQKSNLVDITVYETCINFLRASTSSAHLQSVDMDKHIVRDFNDSLISSVWELLLCNTSPMVSLKGQMQVLYEGLRFLRSMLRKPLEQMDELNGKIITVLSEAGIVICSLYVNKVYVDNSVGRDSPDCCDMLLNVNSDIKLIKGQVTVLDMIESLPSYQIFKGQEVCKISSLMPSKVKITITHEFVVELKDEAEKVIDQLVGGSENLEIIPIVGFAGLGKTTFAKEVYNNPLILQHFHIRLWFTVSQVYNKKKLLLQVFCDDGKHSRMNEGLENLDEGDLLHKLYKKLKGNKYLVVFDDVWDIGIWNDLEYSFPDDKNGSRILFTSRFSNVASEVKIAKEPHSLRSLTDGESWELLQKKVFGKEDCPQALHGVGLEIAENCKGLPLTVVIIAGILATIEQDGWQEVAKSVTSIIVNESDDLCKNTLKLSYECLPHHLKPCLLYFGAFPEDREIKTKKLLRLWIAEGFVQNTEPKRTEDIAEEYMMDLIGRNLVMVAKKRSTGGVKACCIHDLLHEFCKSKAKEENFLQVLQGYDELCVFNEHPNLQRLSIWSKEDHFMKSRIFCPNLGSLLFFNQFVEYRLSEMGISYDLSIYNHLRVLDLEPICLVCKGFPSEINGLFELRYLAIRGKIAVIPPSVANLSNLETFLVTSYYVGVVSLPETIRNMKKLRHLHIRGHVLGYSLPNGNLENSSNSLNLETFSSLVVDLEKCLEEIVKRIPNIHHLQIRLKLNQSLGSTGNCSSTLLLDSLSQLESLKLSTFCWRGSIPVLEYYFPTSLTKLTLKTSYLPWSKISLIEELPNLQVLKLLIDSFVGKIWDMKGGGFPKLKVLSLEQLDVMEWTDTDCDGNCFPCLEKLLLVGWLKLEKVPYCLESIPTLEMIKLKTWKGNESLASLVRRIENEQQSNGNENLKILIDYYAEERIEEEQLM